MVSYERGTPLPPHTVGLCNSPPTPHPRPPPLSPLLAPLPSLAPRPLPPTPLACSQHAPPAATHPLPQLLMTFPGRRSNKLPPRAIQSSAPAERPSAHTPAPERPVLHQTGQTLYPDNNSTGQVSHHSSNWINWSTGGGERGRTIEDEHIAGRRGRGGVAGFAPFELLEVVEVLGGGGTRLHTPREHVRVPRTDLIPVAQKQWRRPHQVRPPEFRRQPHACHLPRQGVGRGSRLGNRLWRRSSNFNSTALQRELTLGNPFQDSGVVQTVELITFQKAFSTASLERSR